VIGAFFDDSGTHGDSTLVAMGGLLGTDPQWDAFVERWKRSSKRRSPTSVYRAFPVSMDLRPLVCATSHCVTFDQDISAAQDDQPPWQAPPALEPVTSRLEVERGYGRPVRHRR
jgi:hypothetical protein